VVAVVAAETYEAACIAVDKIKITYTPWEPITSPEEAMKPGARLIHSELDSNIINRHHTAKGDVDAGLPPPAIFSNVSMKWVFRSMAILSRNPLPPAWTIMNRS
jgi:CO/xanthine dehydrogenase Mo-binding subunit